MEASAQTQTLPGASRGGKVARRIAISIATAIALINVLGGIALIAVHLVVRDDDGYYSTGTEEFATDTRAIAVKDIDLSGQRGDLDIEDLSAAIRIQVESSTGEPAFVGIAPREDIDSYLAGSAYTVVDDFGNGPPSYDQVDGAGRPALPSSQDIWAASSQGAGQQSVEWEAEIGEWAAVAMNADAAKGLEVEASSGVKIGWLHWVGLGLIVFGAAIGGVTWLIARDTRRR
ncbi:MAG TPA: hypothetical protein VD766_12770 [Solirubrobacterales bacterium]|nr:hypothetical protein [Solirubrobacterales bacterium]